MASKKQIIVPIVILLSGALIMAGLSSLKKPPEEKKVVDDTPIVEVQPISVAAMTLFVNSYGIVKPKYETELVAQVSGQIVELSNTFVRGGFVKKGQVLARIDPSDYEAALIDAQAGVASARAAFKTELAQGEVAKTEWQQITNAAPTELSLRKPQLAQELARVKAAQASVLRAKRNMERTEIVAPYDAMIDSRTIGLGSFVSTGSKVGKLLATAVAEVRLPVSDSQLQFLRAQGNKAHVKLKGAFAGKNLQWQANIVRDEGVVDDTSRMSYLVAEIKDPYRLTKTSKARSEQAFEQTPLRFGAYVTAEILGKSLASATLIPRYLVVDNKVAILDSDSKLHYTTVNVVRQEGANVVISAGLLEGDRLIVSALDYPVDGMKLALITDNQEPEKVDPDIETKAGTQIASLED